MKRAKNKLPGSIFQWNERFYWKVKLPGTQKRTTYPLCPPGEKKPLASSRGRNLAESIAWRKYEQATHESVRETEPDGMTLDQVCSQFLAWANTYYRHSDGTPTGEHYNCELALRELRLRYRDKGINEITYHDILRARDEMVNEGITRSVVNQRVGIWKRMFAWALDSRLCNAYVKSEVWAINSLKRNRSSAPEGKGQSPVAHRDVKVVLPFLPPELRAMVQVHELCGARPGEMCRMRPCDIDRRRKVWIYEPQMHKTEHTGRHRIICLGPRAQKILALYIDVVAGDEYIFKPLSVREWRKQQGQKVTKNPSAKNQPANCYNKDTYRQAIQAGIKQARKAGHNVDWTPNQLRHACATRVRKRYGQEAARILLGHAAQTGITDRYTWDAIKQEELRIIRPVMEKIG